MSAIPTIPLFGVCVACHRSGVYLAWRRRSPWEPLVATCLNRGSCEYAIWMQGVKARERALGDELPLTDDDQEDPAVST